MLSERSETGLNQTGYYWYEPFYFDTKPFRYTSVKLFLNNSERRGQVDEKSIRNKSIKSSL